MEIITVNIDSIIPYENNPRINDDAVEAVAQSIQQVGYVNPIIVDEDMIILAGHTRFRALNMLGEDTVSVIVMRDLNDEQKKQYRILDNKTNEFAQWDFDKLREETQNLDFGFDFGFDSLFSKDDNIKEMEKKAKEMKPMSKICTCPRCGKEWEE